MSTERRRAEDWLALLADPGTTTEVLTTVRSGDPLAWPGYAELRAAQPGEEAVRIWTGRLDAHPCVLVVFDFAHLGGSMGAGVGARVAGAFDLAVEARLPVVTVASTGGSRMQEGMVALSQMARTTVAALRHRRAGLLHVGVAADPTTGGVYASFLSQADVLLAVADAYLGFAGPRVAATLGDGPPPPGTNDATFALRNGLVDAVVGPAAVRGWIAGVLAVTATGVPTPAGAAAPDISGDPPDGWQAVRRARAPDRPRAADYLALLGRTVRLSGDRAGGVDDGVIACLARLDGRPVGVVGLDRRRVLPAGYRTALRLLDLAERLGLGVVTLIDTPGAHPGPQAEAAGQAHAISATLARLVGLRVPTVGVVIGEGGSGGAMALAVADRLLIQEGAMFSVIAPEGAAAILHRDAARAPDVAARLGLAAHEVVRLGVADAVVPDDPQALLGVVAGELDRLAGSTAAERLDRRLARWGRAGEDFVVR